MHTVEKRIKEIISSWFFSKPLLFSTVCTHSIIENQNLSIPMRSGQMRIEFNPLILEKKSMIALEQYLQVEVHRILLEHPYKRQPYKAQKKILLLASDVTIYQLIKKELTSVTLAGVEYLKSQAERFKILENPLGEEWAGTDELKFFQRNLIVDSKTGELKINDSLTFEEWYKWIYFLIKQSSIGGENAGTATGEFIQAQEGADLWEENEEALEQIQDEIKNARATDTFAQMEGTLVRTLNDECDFSFDYRKALTQFRANIVSNSRRLTRMKPSRRYGFKAMGSRYERKANILIAVDVSGSITDQSFEHFYHAIKNFFFLGIIQKIDLIFFDVNLKNTTPVNFTRKVELKEIQGRGGTNFQPPLDYYLEKKDFYNGLIIFTDGEGEIPAFKGNQKSVLWILDSYNSWKNTSQWISNVLGHRSTYLPF